MKENKKQIIIGVGSFIAVIVLILVAVLLISNNKAEAPAESNNPESTNSVEIPNESFIERAIIPDWAIELGFEQPEGLTIDVDKSSLTTLGEDGYDSFAYFYSNVDEETGFQYLEKYKEKFNLIENTETDPSRNVKKEYNNMNDSESDYYIIITQGNDDVLRLSALNTTQMANKFF